MIVNFISVTGEKNREDFLDFFNRDGQFLGSLKIEEELLYVDENDNFYFKKSEPFVKISKKNLTIR